MVCEGAVETALFWVGAGKEGGTPFFQWQRYVDGPSTTCYCSMASLAAGRHHDLNDMLLNTGNEVFQVTTSYCLESSTQALCTQGALHH